MTRNESPSEDAAQAETPTRQRIAKLMARVGLCSRREAEAWIVDGRVRVNGTVLTSPAVDVAADDAILVDGAPLPKAQKTRLFLFHKPRGLVTSDHDPEGRATVAAFLRERWPEGPRVVTVGRLDINTEGLLLLTNDGGLARVLELPRTGWMRRYRVRANGETDQGVLDRLREGVAINGVEYAGIEATLDRAQGANVWLTMGLREGKNREVKRVLESIGLEVNRLIRISFGPFQLGDLATGAVEEVRTRVLRDQLGAALAAAAGAVFEEAAVPAEPKPRGDRKPPAETAPRERRRDETRSKRGGEQPHGRAQEATPPRRERPAAGTRKHVSTLRAAGAEAARQGPRRRIERSDMTDRKQRAVRVERLIDARPTRPDRHPRDGDGARPRAAHRQDVRHRDARGERPRHQDSRREDARGDRNDARAGHRHASPSALAKRARIAKSGGSATETRGTGGPPRRGEPSDAARPRGRADATRPPDRREQPAEPRFDKGRRGTGDGAGKRSSGKPSRPTTERGARKDRAGAPKKPGGSRPPPRGKPGPRSKR